MDKAKTGFKSGFVAIVGAPNAGKSTLLNRILGQKISITSKKPQTTRNRILGIAHNPNSQMVFLDTPGIHKASKPLNVRIVDVALTALAEADLVLFMADASAPRAEAENFLIGKLRNQKTQSILALNKIDLIKKSRLLEAMARWAQLYPFVAQVPISAKTGQQVEVLIREMEKVLPEGPPFYPPDSLTDLPEKFLVAELIREKAIRLTGQEIPYAVAVTIESFRQDERDNMVIINATIHVERSSQKGIIIGRGGKKLRQIGKAARVSIEKLLGCKVYLELFVRVQKNWSKDTKALRKFGY